MEVNGSGKHFSLLRYGINYCRKKFYSRGPRSLHFKTFFHPNIISFCGKLECNKLEPIPVQPLMGLHCKLSLLPLPQMLHLGESELKWHTPVGQMPVCHMTFGKMPVGQKSVGQMPVGQMPVGQMSVCHMTFGQMPVGQMSVCHMTFGQMPVGQIPVGQMPVGLMAFGQKTWSLLLNIAPNGIHC